MLGNMQPSQGSDPALESRLRNLILTNKEPGPPQSGPESLPQSGDGVWPHSLPNRTAPKASALPPAKKRMNQAQRREMNAELSIPIDPRAHFDNHQSDKHQQNGRPYSYPHSSRGAHRNGSQRHSATASNATSSVQQQRHHTTFAQGQNASPDYRSDWRAQQPNHNGFSRGVNVLSADSFPSRGRQGSHPSLYNHEGYRSYTIDAEEFANQSHLLDQLCHLVVSRAEIEFNEIAEKEDFRIRVEAICRSTITHHETGQNENTAFPPDSTQLKCFGSLSSGFATKAADMDLALLSPLSRLTPDMPDSPIPRLVEKALLDAGYGARLLTRTRVPIIKLCEKPDEKLRLALLEERAKWEQGVVVDPHEADDETLDDTHSPDHKTLRETPKDEFLSDEHRKELEVQSADDAARSPEERLSLFRQSPNQTLANYYASAKRLLRQLNGRDITQSNFGDFKEEDFQLLNVVAGAFVEGLADEYLKLRIRSYQSFHAGVETAHINNRSLAGVMKITEGEQLCMLWETRTLTEGNPQREEMSQNVVNRWKSLQTTKMFGMNPLAFCEDLQHAADSLRNLPSIQLMQIKQEQHETAAEYHSRVVRIMNGLRGSNVPNAVISSKVIEYYVLGIHDQQIREEVREFALTSGIQSLKSIARKHKALQLATEYEKALEKNLYDEADAVLIREYTTLLRRGPAPFAAHGNDPHNYVIPITHATAGLLQRIRQLPDPSKLAPNQPRDRYHDKLEFPKSGVGVQCDINFSAHLALQNTLLLRCYSYTDPRVRPLVLFVKHWAKVRDINSAYRGTLSSYGYVLMMLHYLVNVAEPFVCPNLQQLAPPDPNLPPESLEGLTTCKGRNVRFWRDEQEIQRLAREGALNRNKESIGALLRGFFEYYAQGNMMSTIQKRGFDWGRDVISLRTQGGLLSKQEKGWTGARTIIQPQMGGPVEVEQPLSAGATSAEHNLAPGANGNGNAATAGSAGPTKPKETKEVRLRYLFAIEDPFELDHNVARTVTHNGIVAIRDEFRRAWRTIKAAGKTAQAHAQAQEVLLEDAKLHTEKLEMKQSADLLDEIHGPVVFPDGALGGRGA